VQRPRDASCPTTARARPTYAGPPRTTQNREAPCLAKGCAGTSRETYRRGRSLRQARPPRASPTSFAQARASRRKKRRSRTPARPAATPDAGAPTGSDYGVAPTRAKTTEPVATKARSLGKSRHFSEVSDGLGGGSAARYLGAMKRYVTLVGVPVVVSLVSAPTARATDQCYDQCHVDRTSGGGGCNNTTEEERQAEARCFADCREGRQAADGWSRPPNPPSGECAETTTMDTCTACCSEHHAVAATGFEAGNLACFCESGICAIECASSACATPARPTSASCATCLNHPNKQTERNSVMRSCSLDSTNRCRESPTCAPFLDCMKNGCRGKT
jgi:hypothetical protein